MGRLPKSGLESFALIEDLVFGVKFDNQLRKAAQTGSIVENVFEFADVKEKWDEITAQLQDEDSERKAAQGLGDETARERRRIRLSVVILRKGPQNFAQNSVQYWRAVANQTVRTYIALVTEPRTQESVLRAVEQSHVQKVTSGNVLTLLDLNLLGESVGPGANELLRKRLNPSEDLFRKLVHGTMLARGAQRKEDDQCTCPAEADFVFVHVGDRSKKDVRVLFRVRGTRADSMWTLRRRRSRSRFQTARCAPGSLGTRATIACSAPCSATARLSYRRRYRTGPTVSCPRHLEHHQNFLAW